MVKKIRTELQFMSWFDKNFKEFDYEKIIKKNLKKFPDYIMLKKGKKNKSRIRNIIV